MKKIENSFAVTGFVGKDAEIRQFANTSVARFSMAVSRQEKNGDDSNRISAFINVEAWRKNEKTIHLKIKGTLLTVEGYFNPEEWTDKEGVKHDRIVMVATSFYPAQEKEGKPKGSAKGKKKEECKNVSSKEFINLNDTIFTVSSVYGNEYQGGIFHDVNILLFFQFHQGFPCFLRRKSNIDLSATHLFMPQ